MLQVLVERLGGDLPLVDAGDEAERILLVLGSDGTPQSPHAASWRHAVMLPMVEVQVGPAWSRFDSSRRMKSIDQVQQQLYALMRAEMARLLGRMAAACGPCDFKMLVRSCAPRAAQIRGAGADKEIGSVMELQAGVCACIPFMEGGEPDRRPRWWLPSPREIMAAVVEPSGHLDGEMAVWEVMSV